MTDNTMAPPALAQMPQFEEAYWIKAPRTTQVAHIQRVTNVEDGWKEIVLKEGMRFRRRAEEIQQLLTANLEVHVETFNNELVTGLMVPGVGWAFRMTAQDLADYAKQLHLQIHEQRALAKRQMALHVADAIATRMDQLGFQFGVDSDRMDTAVDLALAAITALENGPG